MNDERERSSGADDPARRRLVPGYFVAVVLVAAMIAGIVVVIAGGGNGSPVSDDPFAPQYEGLEDRRTEAGVPTMAEGGGEHFHPLLEVYVRGEQIPVPANIGIDPAQPPEPMAGLHTHDTTGTIHNEAGTGSTLGQFFEVWGVEFTRSRLGPYEADGEEKVRMWVDGGPSQDFGDLELADGQQIVVSFGSNADTPSGLGS
ncbi:MAG: hypothetical protein AABM42_12645 [Actinomycetota bacterium]